MVIKAIHIVKNLIITLILYNMCGCLMPPPPKLFLYKKIMNSKNRKIKLRTSSSTVKRVYLDLWSDVLIVNKTMDTMKINNFRVYIDYKNIDYKDYIYNLRIKLPGELKWKYTDKVQNYILLGDTLALSFIHLPNRKIKEKEFINYWKKDTLKIRLIVNDSVFKYYFIGDEL